MKYVINCLAVFLLVALSCQPAAAWIAAGRRGVAAGGGGSWGAVGRFGGTASGGGGVWHATGPYGNTAYGGANTYYGGGYASYHPPVVVNSYSTGCYNCGGWSTAGAAAAGVVVGVAAGAAIADANTAQANENAYAAGVAAGSAYAMGAIYPTLPEGCVFEATGGTTAYYHCSDTWFSPAYGANGVYYRVVPAP